MSSITISSQTPGDFHESLKTLIWMGFDMGFQMDSEMGIATDNRGTPPLDRPAHPPLQK
jgi:hypothetical protein